MTPLQPLTVCVFGGARPGRAQHAVAAAARAGSELAQRGHRLLYGAGGSGVMGAVARAAHAGGAQVIGVIPRFLYELERAQDAPPQEHVITNDMSERKRYMLDNSDAFLALPGGYGTVDEVLDVISLQTLGQLDKQCVLLDPDGVWKHLIRLLEELPRRGFADPIVGGLLRVVTTPEAAFDLIESHPVVQPAR